MSKNVIGKKVTVKKGWYAGSTGTVTSVINYHGGSFDLVIDLPDYDHTPIDPKDVK